MKKYTFVEFVAALECKDFDVLEDSWLEWSKKLLKNILRKLNNARVVEWYTQET